MRLTSFASFALLFFIPLVDGAVQAFLDLNATDFSFDPCPRFGPIENGTAKVVEKDFRLAVKIVCDAGYDLDGPQVVSCVAGKWIPYGKIECQRGCQAPPYLKDGTLEIDGQKDSSGLFHKGTVATYNCKDGYSLSPSGSRYRVCVKGIWTGPVTTCLKRCPRPKEIVNGYFVEERFDEGTEILEGYNVGQRLHYSCKSGFGLTGASVQQCLEDGTWSPKIAPVCSAQITEEPGDYTCLPAPSVPHSYTTVIQGFQSEELAYAGTVVQIRCISRYRNTKAPCQPGRLRCAGGEWVGTTPVCVPVHECGPPPAVFAAVYNLMPSSYGLAISTKYPIKSQISYECLPGYTLQGNEIFTCSSGGCWLPIDPPNCYRTPSYYMEVNSFNAVLISGATAAGVLGLLLVICLVTVYRRRKPLTRAVTIAPPIPRSDLGDHATLLHPPDRLALIAFADGMQSDQSALPTYDEATRDRTSALTSTNRLHRPHWPNLSGRRSRSLANPDIAHVTRHGSFASHTPSTRSGGDSMGSTDTMAVSEGSTNVTLDTASSHSGSQPASCRVHCGSLASFDTSSVVNCEGVPLLEESELEEVQGGDNVSLVLETPSISDNASFKLSTNSSDLV